eukprot:TRINITY_DN35977_c0_g1_i1.p1 TRINITY_DN35977_c0_g1~~TRINITY_DN35977_c0_g1_i1.p1  ORF type:complete len:471 (+),score=170.61 TRINITY_DN35977_c0_g1_i1:80-1414(+)
MSAAIEVTLVPGSELRFEVPAGSPTYGTVRLIADPGKFAEVCGAELAPGHTYTFPPGTNASVFTWHGCRVRLTGIDTDLVYRADNPPMTAYARTHGYLEKMRQMAKSGHADSGPRVLICGPPDTGKATIARLLVNYAARLNWDLTYVDLNVANNSIAVPGCVAAVPVDLPVPIDEGFSAFPAITYYYGDTKLEGGNEQLYSELVGKLAADVAERAEANDRAAQGGVVVKAMACGGGKQSIKLLMQIARAFRITTVLVTGDDRLYAQLRRDLDTTQLGSAASLQGGNWGKKPSATELPKSGGCVSRSEAARVHEHNQSLEIYFRGWEHMRLHSSIFRTSWSKVSIVRVGAALPTRMDGLLPVDGTSALNPLEATPVTPSKELEDCVLALSQSETVEGVALAPVYGFARVVAVSLEKEEIDLLIPSPAKQLLSTILVVGEVRTTAA